MATSLSTTTLHDFPRGDEVKKTDGTTGALSDTVALVEPAVAILITGSGALSVRTPAGTTRTFADGDLAKNVWHPMKATGVNATGTTLAASGFRLGFARF